MTISKENTKLETRLVDIQNRLGSMEAKLNAFMKTAMKEGDLKAIKLPPKEQLPQVVGTPYPMPGQAPASTIDVPPTPAATDQGPVVDEDITDMNTIEAPVTPTADQIDPATGKPYPPTSSSSGGKGSVPEKPLVPLEDESVPLPSRSLPSSSSTTPKP